VRAGGSQAERVLVSGLGPVTCMGFGTGDMASGVSAMNVVRGTDAACRCAADGCATLPELDLEQFIETPPRYLDPRSRYILAAGSLAFDSASLQHDEVDPEQCGLCLGTAVGNTVSRERYLAAVAGGDSEPGPGTLFMHAMSTSTDEILASQFRLRGYSQSLSGDALCGAQALECAALALQSGRARLMLAGGADVVGTDLLETINGRLPGTAPAAAQGVGLLALETEDALEKREGFAFCELAAIVCRGTHGRQSPSDVQDALSEAMGVAMDEAEIWEGDVGMVFVSSARSLYPSLEPAQDAALRGFSSVPVSATKRFVGETFAAGFPLECIAAADALNVGMAPPQVTFVGTTSGVEFWVERQSDPLMGDSALVVGCTPYMVAVAVLRTI